MTLSSPSWAGSARLAEGDKGDEADRGSVVQMGEVEPVRQGREEGRSDRHFLPYFVLSPV